MQPEPGQAQAGRLAPARASNASPATRRTRPSGPRFVVTALEVVAGLAIIAAVAFGLMSATRQSDHEQMAAHETTGLPSDLGGLKLVRGTAGGPDAMQALSAMHGTDVGLVDARIGEYERAAAVWVGIASSSASAKDLVDRMTQRITAGATPAFVHLGDQQVAGYDVHQVRGDGQMHYYYQKGSEVVWLAAPAGANARFVSLAIAAIP